MKEVNDMSVVELNDLKISVEDRIRQLQRKEKFAKKHTREEIIGMFCYWGYLVPKGAKIWRLHDTEHEGGYGMEVGGYEHSCHVDSTDFKVLLVVDGMFHGVKSYGDLWISDCLVV